MVGNSISKEWMNEANTYVQADVSVVCRKGGVNRDRIMCKHNVLR